VVTWTNLTPRSCFVVSIAPRKQPGQEIVEDNDNWFSWHKLSDRRSGSKTLGSGRIRNRGSGEQRNMGRGLRRSFWWTQELIRNAIHQDGGPLIHNGWEDDQRSFDSTCRRFHRFLTQTRR
jgi:hypothetical protein